MAELVALRPGHDSEAIAAMPTEARPYGAIILRVAKECQVCPFILTAIGMRESRWGLSLRPFGPSGVGDAGHGRGLMQIDDRSHVEWLRQNDWTDPYLNVRKGAEVLLQKQEFLSSRDPVLGLTDGTTVHIGLKQAARRRIAAGAYRDLRPLQGEALVRASLAAYNTGEGNVLMSVCAGLDPDCTTASADYSRRVLARALELAKKSREG